MKRRTLLLAVVWAAATVTVTGWVASQADGATWADALLVGVLLGSVLTVAVATLKR